MYFHSSETRDIHVMLAGVRARSFCGDSIMLVLVDLEPNSTIPTHHHPNEQAGMVLSGEIEFTIGGETKLLHKGDIYTIPSDVPHSVMVGANPVQVLDVFSPIREDLKY